jgi:hypothetical protein
MQPPTISEATRHNLHGTPAHREALSAALDELHAAARNAVEQLRRSNPTDRLRDALVDLDRILGRG